MRKLYRTLQTAQRALRRNVMRSVLTTLGIIIGVAAVISGDFSGWNFGIGEAGWGGLAVASVVIVVMYFGMLFSIGEMSAAMPHTGGAYSFARASMGPWGGFVTGVAETIEYVFTTGVIVYFSSGYANAVTDELVGLDVELVLRSSTAHDVVTKHAVVRNRSEHAVELLRGLALFYLVCGIGALANNGVAALLLEGGGLGWGLAGVAGAVMTVVWNYVMSATLVWRAR